MRKAAFLLALFSGAVLLCAGCSSNEPEGNPSGAPAGASSKGMKGADVAPTTGKPQIAPAAKGD